LFGKESESIDFKFKSPTGEIITIPMKYALWVEDQSLLTKLVDPHGQPNTRELWIQRMMIATGLDDKTIRKFPAWKMSALVTKWLLMNDVTPDRFLGEDQKEVSQQLSSIILSNQNLESQTKN